MPCQIGFLRETSLTKIAPSTLFMLFTTFMLSQLVGRLEIFATFLAP